MAYTVQEKFQIEVVKRAQMFYADFEDYVLIVDGNKGVYIDKRDLLIDISKCKKFKYSAEHLSKEHLQEVNVPAEETSEARILSHKNVAIKLKAKDGTYAWVNREFLKMYGASNHYMIKGKKDIILVRDFTKMCLGIVLPVDIRE
ncbi:hypothetical protein ACTQ6A_02815 [Lachnospiraceae bacterium LCP25S3_G4]